MTQNIKPQIRFSIDQSIVDQYKDENPDTIDPDTNKFVLTIPLDGVTYQGGKTREIVEGFDTRFATKTVVARQWQLTLPIGVAAKEIIEILDQSPSIPCENGLGVGTTKPFEQMYVAFLNFQPTGIPFYKEGLGWRYSEGMRILLGEVS